MTNIFFKVFNEKIKRILELNNQNIILYSNKTINILKYPKYEISFIVQNEKFMSINYICEYKPNILGIIGIVLPILFAIIAYSIFKKNGVDDVVIETVEFYPPNGYSSLDLGLYYRGLADSKDVTSLLIYLANKK